MRAILFLLLIIIQLSAFSQEIEMADQMRAEGKIYVVVAVVLTILIGLLFYLFSLDRKLKKLEDTVKDKS